MAFKVVADRSGKPMLRPAWMSRDIAVPEPVAIAGGVVFALATGENTEQVYEGDIHRLIKDRTVLMQNNAMLYALDAEIGRELWNSGTTITEWAHFSGLAIGAGKVFMVTRQGGLYAFGLSPSGTASRLITIPRSEPAPPNRPPTEGAVPSNIVRRAESLGCERASELFQRKCAMCHNPNGKGSESTHTPDFTDPKWQASRSDGALIEAIKEGKEGEGRMPAFEKSLTAQEIELFSAMYRARLRGATRNRRTNAALRPVDAQFQHARHVGFDESSPADFASFHWPRVIV